MSDDECTDWGLDYRCLAFGDIGKQWTCHPTDPTTIRITGRLLSFPSQLVRNDLPITLITYPEHFWLAISERPQWPVGVDGSFDLSLPRQKSGYELYYNGLAIRVTDQAGTYDTVLIDVSEFSEIDRAVTGNHDIWVPEAGYLTAVQTQVLSMHDSFDNGISLVLIRDTTGAPVDNAHLVIDEEYSDVAVHYVHGGEKPRLSQEGTDASGIAVVLGAGRLHASNFSGSSDSEKILPASSLDVVTIAAMQIASPKSSAATPPG